MLDTTVTVGATGDVLPAEAWRRWSNLDEWPKFSPQIGSVECETRTLAAGITGRVRSVLGPGVAFEVLAVDPETRSWQWRVTALGLSLELDHRNEPAARPDGRDHHAGTTSTVRIHGFAPVVLAYAPLAAWALRRLVRP